MGIYNDLPSLVQHINQHMCYLKHNHVLLDIYEGNLKEYVDATIDVQLSKKSAAIAKQRCAPINVLKRITDKLSKIYQQSPVRRVVDGIEPRDSELLAWYTKSFKINQTMNVSDEFFNIYKSALVQPFLIDGKPKLRAIPNDRFLVYSNNAADPTTPTHVLVYFGEYYDKKSESNEHQFHVYTDTEFAIINTRGEIMRDEMAEYGNPEGLNPYGKIPFVYINRSATCLLPKPDSDTLQMTLLLPLLLTDLNFAVMFQSFSIIYGIDVDPQALEMSPNAFWELKSDKTSDKSPQIGSIKPTVEIQEVLNLIQSQFSLWLNTRGIKAGSVGALTPDNFASGVSKMIDEMDTSEERQKQVEFYKDGEEDLWKLVFNYMHPYWVATGQVDNQALFTPTAEVTVSFHEQLPTISRGNIVAALKAEVDAGFISKERAIKKLNPEFTSDQVDELLLEIDEEKGLVVQMNQSEPVAEQTQEEPNGAATET